jgi:hypothetical protein
VGFGGLEYIDFVLFRRSLGVERMISIEQDTARRSRYEFNLPFSGIELLSGVASVRLPDIDWRELSIVWLDYEAPVTAEIVSDLAFLAQELIPGSVLIITSNAATPKPADQRRRTLVQNVGEELVPPRVTDDTLARWGWAAAQRDIALAGC